VRRRLSLEGADQFVAGPAGAVVRAGNELGEVRDLVGSDRSITFGLLGVVADHEPRCACPLDRLPTTLRCWASAVSVLVAHSFSAWR
jgi:hypothetical protein